MRRNKETRFFRRVMIAYSAVILGAVLSTATAYYVFSSDYLRRRAEDDMRKTGRLTMNAIEKDMESLSLYSRLLSGNYNIRTGIIENNARLLTGEITKEQNFLNADFVSIAGENAVVMANVSRMPMASDTISIASTEPLFLSGVFQKVVSDNNGAAGVEPVFPDSIAVLAISPVKYWTTNCKLSEEECRDTGKTIGYVRIGYYLDKRFVDRMSALAGTKIAVEHGGVYIVSGDGTDELNENPEKYFSKYLVMREALPGDEKDSPRLVTLYSKSGIEMIQRRGVLAISAIALLSFIGFFIVSSWVARRITEPILDLTKGVRRIEEGDLKYMIPHTGRDEMGALAKSFNRMTEALGKRDLEIRKNQEQLIESGKLAAVGELAAGVAHEIGNPLAAIYGYLQLLSANPTDEKRDHYLEEIKKESGYIDSIIRQLLEFSRQSGQSIENVTIDDVVSEALKMISFHKTMKNVGLLHDRSDRPLVVRGSHKELVQAVMNITLNAAQAMNGCGKIVFSSSVNDEGYAELRISDNGPGIPRKILPRIFEPFFTTKGTGTGLGLSITYKIIQNHNGSIRVESSMETGTTFILSFPVVRECETDEQKISG